MNNSNILVTVECIVFNHEPYLRQCLEGFVMQKTNFDFEVLVHDDASTDGSKAIIQEYAERYPAIIKPLYEMENQYQKGGFCRIIQLISKHIKGQYVAICEGDDFWIDPLKLQKQVDYMEAHPTCGLVYTKIYQLIQATGETSIGWPHQASFEEIIANDNPISTPAVLIRKTIHDEFYSTIKVNPEWKMTDLPLWIYVSHQTEIKCLDDITTTYRSLENSASHSTDIRKMICFTYSAYDIRVYFAKYFGREDLMHRINRHCQNCLFKLSISYNENISWEILKFGIRTHSLSLRLLLKCCKYALAIGRRIKKDNL